MLRALRMLRVLRVQPEGKGCTRKPKDGKGAKHAKGGKGDKVALAAANPPSSAHPNPISPLQPSHP